MITNALITLLSWILNMIHAIFSAFNYIIPSQIPNAFYTFFSFAKMGNGIFPMTDILLAILSVLTVWILLYAIKVIMWVFSLIPWIGKQTWFPGHKMRTGDSATLRSTNGDYDAIRGDPGNQPQQSTYYLYKRNRRK